jgi:hypothetical protein
MTAPIERQEYPEGAGAGDGLLNGALGLGSSQGGLAQGEVGLRVTLVLRAGAVVLEPLRELVAVLKDLSDAEWHSHHLRIFSRAGMAWTTTSAPAPSTTPTLSRAAGRLGPTSSCISRPGRRPAPRAA